jgi:hypothetical protein
MEFISPLEIEYISPLICPQICLRWQNSKGGFETFVFVSDINITPGGETGEYFERVVNDISQGKSLFSSTGKKKEEIVSCSAIGIEKQAVRALSFIQYSPKVWEVKQTETGFSFVEVYEIEVETEILEKEPFSNITVTFKRPFVNV